MDSANNNDSPSLPEIVRKLQENEVQPTFQQVDARRAGVALILKAFSTELHVMFIRRALRDSDPWSGHIAFPGGHHEQRDTDLLQTVIRETQEEVGINLSSNDCLGQLPYEQPYTSLQRDDLRVWPFIFLLKYEPELTLNHEVADAIWISLDQLLSGELLTYETVNFNANEYRLPGYRLLDEHFVWGLTFRVIQRFLSIIGPN